MQTMIWWESLSVSGRQGYRKIATVHIRCFFVWCNVSYNSLNSISCKHEIHGLYVVLKLIKKSHGFPTKNRTTFHMFFFGGGLKKSSLPLQGAANPIMPACGDGVANVRMCAEKMGVVDYNKMGEMFTCRSSYGTPLKCDWIWGLIWIRDVNHVLETWGKGFNRQVETIRSISPGCSKNHENLWVFDGGWNQMFVSPKFWVPVCRRQERSTSTTSHNSMKYQTYELVHDTEQWNNTWLFGSCRGATLPDLWW